MVTELEKYDYASICRAFMDSNFDVGHKPNRNGLAEEQIEDRSYKLNKYIEENDLPCRAFVRNNCVCIRRTDRNVPILDDLEYVEKKARIEELINEMIIELSNLISYCE